MLRIALLAGLLSAFIPLNLSAQHIARSSAAEPDLTPGTSHTYLTKRSDVSTLEKSYVIEFEGLPALLQAPETNKNALHGAALFSKFDEDLNHISSLAGKSYKIQDRYSSVFNGVSITAASSLLGEIRQLPYVKRVFEDGEMQGAIIGGASGLIRDTRIDASQVSEFTGEGVVVAIIDSGVDYTHPDLRDGYLGGYDYVNDDADPMDDNGHGTHVAGIVAGNGETFMGTAPDVKFLALKVLDEAGRGFDSAVLRAIEHAVNPDSDPFTRDEVDIINLSISSLEIGMADHPVTIAVQNAVEAGIVCVVAAGNRGEEGRASITAPGNATKAITVGATDAEGRLASFSSQGPSGSITAYSSPFFGLKPDILAPGVEVLSTGLGGNYEARNGTSMASPYIAGLAARMIQQFPDWDPNSIKARLMQQARDVGESIWAQGAGFVNHSDDVAFIVSPACIDLGLVYEAQTNWTRSESLRISNVGAATSSYDIRIRDGLPEGIQAIPSTSQLTLGPGESIHVGLDLIVNPALLQVQSFPEGYVGYIDVISTSGTVAIPFSVFKPNLAHVQLEGDADHIVLQQTVQDESHIFVNAPDLKSIFVAPDTYDIIAQFDGGRFTVIREAVELGEASLHVVKQDDAVHEIKLDVLDSKKKVLDPLAYEVNIQRAGLDWSLSNYVDLSASSEFPMYFSSLSDAYSIEINVSAFSDQEDYYEIPFVLNDGVEESIFLENDSERLKRFRFRYTLPDGIDRAYFIPWSMHNASLAPLHYENLSQFTHPGYVLRPPFEKNVYTSPGLYEVDNWRGFGHSIVKQVSDESQKLSDQHTLFRTSPIVLNETAAMLSMNNRLHKISENEEGYFDLTPGAGDGFWAGEVDNSASRIRIRGPLGGGLFRGEWGEAFEGAGEWSLWKDGTLIEYDTLLYAPRVVPEEDEYLVERTVEPGAYTLFIRNQAFLSDFGKKDHSVELYIQTDRADPDPPRINALYGILKEDGQEEMVVDVSDVCNWCSPEDARAQVTALQLWVKKSEYGDWTEQSLTQRDSVFVASFNGAVNKQYFALRVRAEDTFGNSMDYYTADESNYAITDPRSVGTAWQRAMPEELSVSPAFPNPSAGLFHFSYALPTPGDVEIFVYDMLGRNVMQVQERQSAGPHEKALDFTSLANGLYIIQVRTGEYHDIQQVVKVQ